MSLSHYFWLGQGLATFTIKRATFKQFLTSYLNLGNAGGTACLV